MLAAPLFRLTKVMTRAFSKAAHFSAASIVLVLAWPASAQRTDDDAVEEADDAFGTSIGGEQIGIYSPENVRGFSTIEAGNVRIEGLYFDQRGHPTDRIIVSRTVRVGISAQGFPFLAPTGIAEYALRKPGSEALASAALSIDDYGGVNAELDAQLPLIGETLGLTAGAGLHHAVTDFGITPSTESYGVSLRFQPSDSFYAQPFFGQIEIGDEETVPLIFTKGDFLPPKFDRRTFYGQPWADFNSRLRTFGTVAGGEAKGLTIGFGLFRSHTAVATSYSDLLLGTDEDGTVENRRIVTDRGNRFASTSGELRLSRVIPDGSRRHILHLSIRGRNIARRYGGSSIVSLGESQVGAKDYRLEPTFSFGPKTHDSVRQETIALGYEIRWRNLGEFTLGVQKTRYRKTVTTPTGELPETRDSPLLLSGTAAVHATSQLAIFGSYVRGLEESGVAPANAVNRNEAPPALRTQQKDVGFRYLIEPRLSLIVGLFEISKPYFNLDPDARFRQLGSLSNRGVEFSLAGPMTPRLTAVVGATYLDSSVSGELVEAGLIGKRPIGAMRLRLVSNLNWQLPWHEPLTLTARLAYNSKRTANSANTLKIPERIVVGLGARYRTRIGPTPLLFRANLDNLFDNFGWGVGGSGFFVPNAGRRFTLTAAADF